MTYLVTQPCCADASCVSACPVDSIHPRPDEAGFSQTDMLYINPETCIECGACVDACPVDAIRHVSDLTVAQQRFVSLNRSYYLQQAPKKMLSAQVNKPPKRENLAGLRVAVVGSGPSALFAAEQLVYHNQVQVDIYEKLELPFGLVRHGLAPDHVQARQITRQFERILAHDRVKLHLNVEVGKDITHSDLLESHSAIVYATGAFNAKAYQVAGSQLTHVHPAAEFVAWYNSHPSAPRMESLPEGVAAAIIGTGNVALDAARLLLLERDRMDSLDLQADVKAALMASRYQTVYLIGRSSPLQASFSYSELQAFLELEDVDVEFHESCRDAVAALVATPDDPAAPFSQRMKKDLYREILQSGVKGGTKRLVLLFHAVPESFNGDEVVQGVTLRIAEAELALAGAGVPEQDGSHAREQEGSHVRESGEAAAGERLLSLPVDFVVTAVGFRGAPITGLPFDEAAGTLCHVSGRVVEPQTQTEVSGVYAVGWIKRGPRGVIGSNKPCSLETVNALIADFRNHKLRSLSPAACS